jgi:hypothetical protein
MSKLTRALSITGAAVVIIGASGNAYQPRETFAPFDMHEPPAGADGGRGYMT